jgi:methionyl-tRNA synthetase
MNKTYSWKENVLQYCKGWFKDKLQDRAVTRDLDWGIPVPLDEAKGKVLYVWFEAVLGYVSATKELSQIRGDNDLWKKYWQDPDTKYIAFIGKDNVVFHTIIFPAMLMAWNDANENKFILPQNVPANEFLNFEGKKFSKSRGWGIDVIDFLKLFPPDPLRYALAANLPETRDTDFYWKEFQARNNNELADILGNFVNRTFTFAYKHFNGEVPVKGVPGAIDQEMLQLISDYPAKIGNLFEKYKIKDGVNEIMNLARAGNKYFNDSEPWKTVKSDKDKCATTINICLQAIYTLAELFSPVIPFSSEKILKMLNLGVVDWNKSGNENLKPGHKLGNVEILFPKIEDSAIEEQITKMGKDESGNKPDKTIEIKEQITIDDFGKIQLMAAEILAAERVPKSDKLLKIQVDLGFEKRQVIAGIAKSYEPENLVGKKVIMLVNLKSAKLMGLESQGMILAVDYGNGKVQVLQVDDAIKPGAKVK